MKIATYNIQNLFTRDLAFSKMNGSRNFRQWTEEFSNLLQKSKRDNPDYDRLRELAFLMGFSSIRQEPYLVLRKRGSQLFVKPKGYEMEPMATARIGWNGWVALQGYPLHEKAIQMKAQVIAEIDPDVLILQEVEDRAALQEFNFGLLPKLKIKPYRELLFVEGNDKRGLGHGLLTKNGYSIKGLQTHAHEQDEKGQELFDLDCPEYTVVTPSGEEITIISARFQEKTGEYDFHAKRKLQAQRLAAYYKTNLENRTEKVIVAGSLQEPYYADALSPLFRAEQFYDICKHENFSSELDTTKHKSYFRLGAYAKGVNITQKDYLLCSTVLWDNVQQCGMNRKGMYPGSPSKWNVFNSLSDQQYAASEHPLLWAQFTII